MKKSTAILSLFLTTCAFGLSDRLENYMDSEVYIYIRDHAGEFREVYDDYLVNELDGFLSEVSFEIYNSYCSNCNTHDIRSRHVDLFRKEKWVGDATSFGKSLDALFHLVDGGKCKELKDKITKRSKKVKILALLRAASQGQIEIIKMLKEVYQEEIPLFLKERIFTKIICLGRVDLVKQLIDVFPDSNLIREMAIFSYQENYIGIAECLHERTIEPLDFGPGAYLHSTEAIKKNQISKFRAILEGNTDLTQSEKNALLIIGIDEEALKAISLLVKLGVDLNSEEGYYRGSRRPLMYAIRENKTLAAKLLVDLGADPFYEIIHRGNALDCAIENDMWELARYLKSKGCQPLKEIFPHRAVGSRDMETLQEILLYRNGRSSKSWQKTPVYIACEDEWIEGLKVLLENGYDPDGSSWPFSPIDVVVRRGDLEMAQILLEAGADPNLVNGDYSSILEYPALHGQIEMMELLVNFDADINHTRIYGDTVLTLAVEKNKKEVVQWLIDHGVDLSSSRWTGHRRYPLTEAIKRGFDDIAEILREAGAEEDPSTYTKYS